jgi:hypothetical protein
MADINLKTLTPDTSLPTTGFLFGADSQASTNPSVYSTQTVATTLLGSTSLTGDTLTASAPVLDLAQTWNNGAVTFTGIKYNATSTASAAGSLLMDLQVGGSSKVSIDKNGTIIGTSSTTSVAANPSTAPNGITFNGSNGKNYISQPQAPGNGLIVWLDNGAGTILQSQQSKLGVQNSCLLQWCNTDSNLTPNLTLRRRADANLQLGTADAALPVAQTLSVQSVVAGTSNTAGATFTINGSQGTGSGVGGSIIFQTAAANTGGGAGIQNTLVEVFSVNQNKYCYLNQGIVYGTGSSSGVLLGRNSVDGFSGLIIGSSASLRWTGGAPDGSSADLALFRDAANTLAQRNGGNAQEFRVYETTTGSIYKAILGNRQLIKISGASFDNGAAAQIGTLSNSPTAGNPTKWIPIDDNGTTRYIPAW